MLQDYKECKESKRDNSTIRGIVKGEEEVAEWMRMVLEKEKKRGPSGRNTSNKSTIWS